MSVCTIVAQGFSNRIPPMLLKILPLPSLPSKFSNFPHCHRNKFTLSLLPFPSTPVKSLLLTSRTHRNSVFFLSTTKDTLWEGAGQSELRRECETVRHIQRASAPCRGVARAAAALDPRCCPAAGRSRRCGEGRKEERQWWRRRVIFISSVWEGQNGYFDSILNRCWRRGKKRMGTES